MNSQTLYKLIEDPSLFSNETLHSLKKMIAAYPCFSLAKIVYLKNLAVLNHPDFFAELKRLSIGIPDRRKLFLLIEDKLSLQSSLTMVGEKEREDAFALIDSFLSTREKNVSADWNETLANASVSSDYLFWTMSKQGTETNEQENKVRLQHHQLIDSFIQNAAERPRRFQPVEPSVNAPAKPEESIPDSINELQDDSFFTETLARIYIKQKRYERALQIIEKLRLKYPEKNVYFADQIRFLEKLIINNKNIK